MTASEYTELAESRIHATLVEHLAVVHPELESRLAERYWHGSTSSNIDPHHITNALRDLRNAGVIEWVTGTTRGGHDLKTIQLADRKGRATKIDRAAARKRLIYARYTGWAQGTKRYPQGLIGPAGETAVRTALTESGALQPAVPGFGETSELLGVKLPGPLDSAGFIVPIVKGMPLTAVTTIIEVKNIRSWIYPTSNEVYQLLSKAVLLQRPNPDRLIVPILICRRAHVTTFWMAKQLGFFIIDMNRQFTGDVENEALLSVRNELHFNDLHNGTGPSLRVKERFQGTLPKHATASAERWRKTSEDLGPTILDLRRSKNQLTHNRLMARLRAESTARGDQGGW